jgi:hypothetical protein
MIACRQLGANLFLDVRMRNSFRQFDPITPGKKQETASDECSQGEYVAGTKKRDLRMRPIYHRKQERTQAQILVCFLSRVMWRTLQQRMKTSVPGTAPRKFIEELREVRSLDVLLRTIGKHPQSP